MTGSVINANRKKNALRLEQREERGKYSLKRRRTTTTTTKTKNRKMTKIMKKRRMNTKKKRTTTPNISIETNNI